MPPAALEPLIEIMKQLRTPVTGCPWDLEQNFASIAPYTIEEAYEVADAIEHNDMDALKDELGDLLLQVVLHSQMANELGVFDIKDVVQGICNKMVRRHPHVFSDTSVAAAAEVVVNWETIKAAERSDKHRGEGRLAGVAMALPALMRAQKLQKRAAQSGFDWPSIDGAIDKLHEEIGEVSVAQSEIERFEEVGDLLFAAVNIARHLGVDAEQALRAANQKFSGRFRAMEAEAGDGFEALDLDAKEELWSRAKLLKLNSLS